MGTRKTTHTDTRTDEDHPHAYGDKRTRKDSISLMTGSSPRVWGQARYDLRTYSSAGIIPTRMGTRLTIKGIYSLDKDHPHAYGDKG